MLPNIHRNPEQVKLYQIKRHPPLPIGFHPGRIGRLGWAGIHIQLRQIIFKSVMNRLYRDNLGLCIQKSIKNPCDVNQKLPSSIRFPIMDDKKQPPDHYHHHYCIKKVHPTRFGSEDKHLRMWQYPLRGSVEILGSCKQSPKV